MIATLFAAEKFFRLTISVCKDIIIFVTTEKIARRIVSDAAYGN